MGLPALGLVESKTGANARFFWSAVATTPSGPQQFEAADAALRDARRLLAERKYDEALGVARTALAAKPGDRDFLYVAAVCDRYAGRHAAALETLRLLEAAHPGYGRLYQERGHCQRELGATADAIESYRQAVAHNPALPASWRHLALLLRDAGRQGEADPAAKVAAALVTSPPAVVAASSHFYEGDINLAETLIRAHLLKHPQDIEGMRLLGRIGLQLKVLDDAEFLLKSVLELAPDYHAARYEYAQALSERQKHDEALVETERLLAIEPGNVLFRTLKGNSLVGLDRHREALEVFFELRSVMQANPTLHLAIGHAQKTIGSQQEAIDSYQAAFQVRPDFGDAYWSLANLKTYRFDADVIRNMRLQEAREDISPEDRYHLCFAIGKALEDSGDYEASFGYYERGNRLKRAEVKYDADALHRNLQRQMEVCTTDFFAARHGYGDKRDSPIFVVGLPRAGSTLIEQILASHSGIEGTKELPEIPRLVQSLNGREIEGVQPRYPSILGELRSEDFLAFGDRYINDTLIYRTGKPFFVDKMPNNFRHVGLIHLMLPHAKIIDARREPMACCFSNFKQLFASGQEFTYGLEDIARYYRDYVELMAHWDAVLPGRVLRIQHEDLVDDLEGNVRRILDYCGLPFEPACIEFHKTQRSVRTASSEQVRRPIFREGLDQWKHFEPWLAPLRRALEADPVG